MSNFFNAIGVADMEKVHSAVIGWMLSDNCGALGKREKTNLLCSLFGIYPSFVFEKIDVKIEVYNIDILITTEIRGIKECWIIENKIKSNQHSNQLDKYVRIINGLEMTKGKNPKPITINYKNIEAKYQHYCFLTLIDEKPLGIHKQKWINTKYQDLFNIMNSLERNHGQDDSIIFKQYLKCIEELTDALFAFLQSPGSYPHVFSDGSKKKTEKDYYCISQDKGKYATYIAECGLETIFQKQWLRKMVSLAVEKNPDIKDLQEKMKVDEDRGTAEFDYTINTLDEKGLNTNGDLLLQVQFQNGTFKVVVIHKDYRNTSNPQKYRDMIYGANSVWQSKFSKKTTNNGWSIPKRGEKARISLTKPLRIKNWYAYNQEDIIDEFVNGFKEALNLAKTII